MSAPSDRPAASERAAREAARRIQAADPQPRLRITGHSDSTGSRAHNLRLSRRRAQAVARVLAPIPTAGLGPADGGL